MDYLILLSSIVLGALTVFVFRLYDAKHIRLLNAFTGAFLLSLTMLHLLPELYHEHGPESGQSHGPLLIGALMLAGFFVQVALDVISMGVEHGHSHPLHGKMPIGIVAGLCLHADWACSKKSARRSPFRRCAPRLTTPHLQKCAKCFHLLFW